ncbi:MAG: cell division protein FtsQ/DivIB [Sideroxydans sp.]|nr:cell division protein FtsQ/DivIB [Sideroxydans sp.]
MWDNHRLLRSIANLLFIISMVLVLVSVVRYVLRLPVFPLNSVELVAAPQRVPEALLEKVAHEQVRGNFFTVDLDLARKGFEALPWVRSVSVRRKFPWGVQVDIEEHVVLARWNKSALVNTYGEVFIAQSDEVLPEFLGQPETSPQVTQLYAELNQTLLPLHQKIVQISLSPRFAWQVKLSDGMVLELGRAEMQERLARFVKVYPYSLAVSAQGVRRVDLRYRNGFSAYQSGGAV